MKKSLFLAIIFLGVLLISTPVKAQETAIASTQRIFINGQEVNIGAYNILDLNYFRIKDIAYALNGTSAQFNVIQNRYTDEVRIYTNTPYIPQGGELEYIPQDRINAIAIAPMGLFSVDDVSINLRRERGVGYSITDNPFIVRIGNDNFIQLRLVQDLTGIDIGFLFYENAIIINTYELREYPTDMNITQRFLHELLGTGVAQMYSMALDSYGNLWAWHEHIVPPYITFSLLEEMPVIRSRTQPEIIMTDVISFSSGREGGYAFAVTSDNILWGWGYNEYGQLGDGTRENRWEPVKIMDNVIYVSTNSAGGLAHPRIGGGSVFTKTTYVIKTDNSLWEWGFSPRWGERTDRPLRHIFDDVIFVSGDYSRTTMVITSDGTLKGFGLTGYVLPGYTAFINDTNTLNRISADQAVKILDNVRFVSVSTFTSAIAIDIDNSLWRWGTRGFVDGTAAPTPLQIMENIERANFTEAIDFNGNVRRISTNELIPALHDTLVVGSHWVLSGNGDLRHKYSAFIQHHSTWEISDTTFLFNIIDISQENSRLQLSRLPFIEDTNRYNLLRP